MPKMLSSAVDPYEGPVGLQGNSAWPQWADAGWPYGVVLKKVHINEGSKV